MNWMIHSNTFTASMLRTMIVIAATVASGSISGYLIGRFPHPRLAEFLWKLTLQYGHELVM